MLRRGSRRALRYLVGVRATPGGSVASLLDSYQSLDSNVKAAATVPSSQRYFYEKAMRNSNNNMSSRGAAAAAAASYGASHNYASAHGVADELSQRHTTVQLRLGAAQLLTATTQRCIANDNAVHPLYFAHTSPREAGLCVPLVLALKRLHITQLTELQGALVPLLLRGKHVIAHAETGTGKSFGIALAIANRILRDNINYRLHTVVLVPTEELALQYDKWLRYFCGSTGQMCQVAIDRIPREQQLARLHNMLPHVLVGTPRRVAELTLLSNALLGEKLRRKVDCVVLDEADLILSAQLYKDDGKGEGGTSYDCNSGNSGTAAALRRMSGVNLVDRLFRTGRDEVPAQLVAASATVDGVTARQLNTWTRNDKTVRLTTSFVEHTIPQSISFYFFAATTSHPLPRCLELVLRVICKQTRHPRVLVFTAADAVDDVVQLLQCELQPRVREAHAWLRDGVGHTDGNDNNNSSRHDDDGSADTTTTTTRPPRVFAAALQQKCADGSDGEDDDAQYVLQQQQQQQRRSSSGSNNNARTGAAVAVATARGSTARAAVRLPQYVQARGHVYVKDNTALSQLNAGKLLIGVAGHDVSRGLHINDVTHVILYGDCPTSTTFAHCVGRTGRMGKEGDVVVLFTPSSGRAVQQACLSFEIPFRAGKLPELESLLGDEPHAHSSSSSGSSADADTTVSSSFGSADAHDELAAANAQLETEQALLSHDDDDDDDDDVLCVA